MRSIRARRSVKSPLAGATAENCSSEFERIKRISKLFSASTKPSIRIAIGDDAAVLRPGKNDLVWTVDSSVQDVHFRLEWLSAEDIGWRSFQAAASDLAAMGAAPIAALSALELPRSFDDRQLERLLRGQAAAASSLGCPIVGGNLASAATLAITTTLLGQTARPLLRSGARVGDELWLIGEVGLAAAGLACLIAPAQRVHSAAVNRCIDVWRRPAALIRQGEKLRARAHCVIDVSDGLVGDAEHIAAASQVAVDIDLDGLSQLLSPDVRRVAALLDRPAIDLALFGGEDYALLASGPRTQRPRWARPIGTIVTGRGVWGTSQQSGRRRLRRGFDHFGT